MNKRAQEAQPNQFVGDSGANGSQAKGFATGYAKYVGRVGALAVALGIGTAVTGGYGIARADEPSTPNVESNVSSGEPAESGHHLRPHHASITDLPHAFIAGVRGVLTGARPDATAVRPRTHVGSRPDDGSEGGETSRSDLPETVAVQHDSRRQSPISSPRIARDHPVQFSRPSEDVADRVDVGRKIVEHVRDVVATPVSQTARSLTVVPAAANLVASQPTSQLTSSPAVRAPIRTVITGLLSVFDRGLTHGGGGPAPENPLLAAVLGFVRRFERTFGNEAPTTHLKQDEIVQVDGQHAVGYLDPTDADGDRVTSSYTTSAQGATGLHGTVAFDPATPGKFTYTAPADRDMTKEWTDTVTITTSDAASGPHLHGLFGFLQPGGGHTTAQTVVVKIEPIANPTVDVADGTVTGKVPNDTEALDYTVEAVDPKVGTVAVDRTTGAWTFTPTADARFAAGKTVGADPVPFTITAVDADGHQTPIQLTASIVPTSVSTITLPPNTTQSGAAVAGSDGSIAVTSYDQGNNKTYVTVIGADGKAHLSDPLPGSALGNPVVNAQGTAYQATRDDTGATTKTYLSVVSPDGTTISTELPGDIQGDIVVGKNGVAYVTSVVDNTAPQPVAFAAFRSEGASLRSFAASDLAGDGGTGGDGDVTTYLTAVGPDGTVYQSDALPGSPVGAVVIGADGTAYQTTTTQLNPDTGSYDPKTYLTVLHTDGSGAVTHEFAGQGYRVAVDSDGTAYQTSGAVVNVVGVDGTVRSIALSGSPIGDPVIGPTGTYAVVGQSSDPDGFGNQFSLTAITKDGTVHSAPLPGEYTYGELALGSTGAVYQTTVHFPDGFDNETRTYVTTVRPDGSIVRSQVIPGYPPENGVVVAPDGTGYQVTGVYDPGTGVSRTYVTSVDPNGSADLFAVLPGQAFTLSTRFLPDGSVYQATETYDGVRQSYANVIDADGTVHTTAIPGDASANSVVIDSRGVIYQTTIDNDGAGRTYLTGMGPDGTVHFTYAVDGYPADHGLVVGPDGAVYQTTSTYDLDTGTFTSYVSSVDANGVVRVSDPIPGEPSSGVIFAADGTPIQGTSSATYTLNPSSLTPRHQPVANGFAGGSASPLDGAVSGTVNVTDPDAGDTLHYFLDPASTAAVGVDPNTGAWTYTPTVAERNAAYATSGPDLTTFRIIASDGLFQVPVSVTAPIDPRQNRPPAAEGDGYSVAGGPSADGTVTGTIDVTDPDGDAVQYYLDPSSTVSVDVDQVTGHWTYTPTAQERSAAYYGAGPADATFTIIATDGLSQTPVVVTAAIAPLPNGETVTLPAGAKPTSPFVIGADGNAYQASYNGTTHQTYVTVLGTDGRARTSGPLPGHAVDSPVPGRQGTVYQLTTDGTKTYANVVAADGTTQTKELPGQINGGVVVGPDGLGYETTTVSTPGSGSGLGGGLSGPGGAGGSGGLGDPSGPGKGGDPGAPPTYVTYVTVLGPDGVFTSSAIQGNAQANVVFAPDGTAYQVTSQTVGSATQTSVTVVDDTGQVQTSNPIDGLPAGKVVFGSDGTPFVATYTNTQTWVTAIDSAGRLHTSAAIAGNPSVGPVVGLNGTVIQTTGEYVGGSQITHVTVVDGNGDHVRAYQFTGAPVNGVVLDADGNAYQTFNDFDAHQTYVAVIAPDGTFVVSDPIPGAVKYSGAQLGPDGVLRLVTDTSATDTTYVPTYDSSAVKTYVTTIAANGDTVVSGPITGESLGIEPYVSADGTVYVTTSAYLGNQPNHSYVSVIDDDGTHTTQLPGAALYYPGVVAGTDGTVYVLSVDDVAQKTYVTTIDSDGLVHNSTAIPFRPAGQPLTVAPDGTVYLTLNAYDGSNSTYLAALEGDGSFRLSDPTPGYSQSGVVIGPDGIVYQTTDTATILVDPTDSDSWELHTAPAVGAPVGTRATSAVVLGDNGVGYQTSHDDASNTTYVSVIGADGVSHTTRALPGLATSALKSSGDTAYVVTSVGNSHYYVNVIGPNGEASTSELPDYGDVYVGPDGKAYVATSRPSPNGGYESQLTVVGPDGIAHTTQTPIPGLAGGPVAITAGGTAYFASTGALPGVGTPATWVTVVGPDFVPHTSAALAGQPTNGIVTLASDGTAYLTTPAANDPVTGEPRTTVYAIDQTGSATPITLVGRPYFDGTAVGLDGVVYQTTSTGDVESGTTYVTAIGPHGAATSGPIPGTPFSSLVVAADGTAYQTTYNHVAVPGQDEPGFQGHLAIVDPDGTTHVSPVLPGRPVSDGLLMMTNGNVYQETSVDTADGPLTYLNLVSHQGAILNTFAVEGAPVEGGVFRGANGVVYLTTAHFDPNGQYTHISIIQANGSAGNVVANGLPSGASAIGSDGTIFQTTTDLSRTHSYVVAIRPNETIRTSAVIPGVPYGVGDGHEITAGPNGTAFQTTYDTATDQTYVTVIGADGSTHTNDPMPGAPYYGGVVIASNGTVYQSTSNGTYVVGTSPGTIAI